ncbi:hypothetical protein Arno18_73 [Pectobacterium phage Arno18]|jgi:hypothetical protein|uniref:DUF7217 domain-containing protein n=1 Tax=Pectobacterium phage Arno18 TaxID=2500578 RepID=A0A678ZN58_9CAUD|nr:hypothetical protein Arno18_73 [Pectobacterium phage Arno18]
MAEPTQQQKDIFKLFEQGKGFKSPLDAGSASLTGSISSAQGAAATLATATNPELAAAGLTPALLANFQTKTTEATGTVTQLTEYGTKATAEFSQRMRVADKYASTAQRFTGVDVGCSAHSGVFGVVNSLGQQAMDTYNEVMNTAQEAIDTLNNAIAQGTALVQGMIDDAVNAINDAITKATEFAQKVVTMIADEAEELARQIAASTHAWLAGVLPDWFGDSCKGSMTDKVSSPELKAAAS